MPNFNEEIDQLTTAQQLFVLGFLVSAIEVYGQATAAHVRQAIEQARAQA